VAEHWQRTSNDHYRDSCRARGIMAVFWKKGYFGRRKEGDEFGLETFHS